MMVEDKILEYLDGSLGNQESAELLETLSVSPEKRALLDEHLRLKDLLTLGRKPFTVPMETERSLAERIPILGRYSDPAPFFGPLAGIRNWIGARAIGLALGAGATIVLAGLGWFALRGNGMNIVPTRSAASQSVASEMRAAPANTPQPKVQDAMASAASNSSTPLHSIVFSRKFTTHIHAGDLQSPIAASSQNVKLGTEDIQNVNPVSPSILAAKAIPIGRNFARTMSELLLPQPKDLSPISVGGSFILNQVNLPAFSNGPSHSLQMLTGDATVDYDFLPSLAIGLDFGEAEGYSLSNSSNVILTPSSDYTRLFESPNISNQTLYDLLITTHLTLFPESEYQIRIGAGGGDAFGAGPIVEATAGISRVLAPGITLDLTAIGSRVWTNGNSPVVNPSGIRGIVGIVGQQAPKSMYTSAFGISAGFRVRLPQ